MATPSVLQAGGKGRKLFEETNSLSPAPAQVLGFHLLLQVQEEQRKNLGGYVHFEEGCGWDK